MHTVDGAADKSPRQQVLEDVAAKAEVYEALERGGQREHSLKVDEKRDAHRKGLKWEKLWITFAIFWLNFRSFEWGFGIPNDFFYSEHIKSRTIDLIVCFVKPWLTAANYESEDKKVGSRKGGRGIFVMLHDSGRDGCHQPLWR